MTIRTFTFDGFTFDEDADYTPATADLYLAYLARRGDVGAAELLDAKSVVIFTADPAVKYWPRPEGK